MAVKTLPGVALTVALAALAVWLESLAWFRGAGLSVLTLAIVLGIVLGNTLYPRLAATSAPGVIFSKQTVLRTGIVLYGLRLTFQDIAKVGVAGIVIDTLVIGSTFALSCWVGIKLLGLDRRAAMLIGVGSSICGAAAVIAAEPVIRGRSEQATIAVSTVVVFGTLGMFLYPALFHWNVQHQLVAATPQSFGIYAGSTIHEVAQVVAAGRAVADSAADTAVITKMVRVMMLAPFLIALSAYLSRRPAALEGGCGRARLTIPWFAVGFIVVTALASLLPIPRAWTAFAATVDTFLLAMAMSALGLTTHASAVRKSGFKPLVLAGILFAWLVLGGLGINRAVWAALS